MLLTLLVCIGLTSVAALALTPLLARIDALLNAGGISSEETAALSKGIGICIITELAADTCRDAGESALATAAELTGKTSLLLISLPLLETLLGIMREVLG